MKVLLELFITFAKMGVVTFGGGYAMLPILQRTVVDDKKWATEEEILDYYAIGQCTPGIIAVNTATFIGYKQKGILGGISATLGVIFPSIIIIGIISAFLKNFSDLAVVQHAFAGIRVCVGVLILNAVIKLWKGAVKGKVTAAIMFFVLIISAFTDISSVLIVIAAGIFGLFFAGKIQNKGAEKK
ncbi:MAG: chromate transporter [Clostridia bacterium]|nr:chromate transporter [Clostridia bacterium]MCI1959708.1 chromate transporter [Clostridia bacterium]MCI1999184.1 chromate transporter [Clostridia bacterium]MCI2014863.1 chromate transporter [Clostridia bacterium]